MPCVCHRETSQSAFEAVRLLRPRVSFGIGAGADELPKDNAKTSGQSVLGTWLASATWNEPIAPPWFSPCSGSAASASVCL